MSSWSPKVYQVLAILENPTFKPPPKGSQEEASGENHSRACKRAAKFRSKRTPFSQPKADFAAVRNFPLAWSDRLPMAKYGIRHHRFSAYRPQTNGAVEVVNKNIKKILRKMVETSRDWSEKLPFALWAYRSSFRTSTRAMPYSLVYGMEVVLLVEIEMGSLRVALEQQILR
ncbi:hypothetical protein CK203_081429 [Vitis vinifera]|uniref:Integrase catalytic domain-containing protein n=1 Tax=Vitis vinifera TaxID=29760 RepID=A0A438DG77_VITVI|nr:hypothetical protein CK203_081429 [Vitis vinifera]